MGLTFFQLGAIDHGLGLSNFDAMHKRLALEIRVDERADDAYFGEAQPNANVLGLVLKKHSHGVAFLEPEPFHEQVGNLVAVVFDLCTTVTDSVSLEAQTGD